MIKAMMENMVKQCEGEGQGSCTLCEKTHGFHRTWMSMLYKIDGFEGNYHYYCAEQMLKEKYGIKDSNIV